MRRRRDQPYPFLWAGVHLALVAAFSALGIACGGWAAEATIAWVARVRG